MVNVFVAGDIDEVEAIANDLLNAVDSARCIVEDGDAIGGVRITMDHENIKLDYKGSGKRTCVNNE
jgi:hypothetical protein